jgi:6-methylsalicylate decarboxylase
MFDYPHETGRNGPMDLIVNDTLRSYPGCKVILSQRRRHAAVPDLTGPQACLSHTPNEHWQVDGGDPGGGAGILLRHGRCRRTRLRCPRCLQLARPGHVLFGTDFPDAPTPSIEYFTKNLAEFEMGEKTRREVYYGGRVGAVSALDGIP